MAQPHGQQRRRASALTPHKERELEAGRGLCEEGWVAGAEGVPGSGGAEGGKGIEKRRARRGEARAVPFKEGRDARCQGGPRGARHCGWTGHRPGCAPQLQCIHLQTMRCVHPNTRTHWRARTHAEPCLHQLVEWRMHTNTRARTKGAWLQRAAARRHRTKR